jgi:hypothetical protein
MSNEEEAEESVKENSGTPSKQLTLSVCSCLCDNLCH